VILIFNSKFVECAGDTVTLNVFPGVSVFTSSAMGSQSAPTGMYALDIKFGRPNKTYRSGESVSGTVSMRTKTEIKHDGVIIELDGSISLQLSTKNLAFKDAFSGGMKPIPLAGGWTQEIAPPGKISVGKTEFPFQFVLEPKSNKILHETYHGVYVAIQYTVKCEIRRSFPSKSIQKNGEFIVEYNDQETKAVEKPVTFTITPDSVHNRERFGNVGRFHITGRLDSTSCCIEKPFTGEVTITHCDRVIRSVDIQLLRVETCGTNESYSREMSEIQTIQIGDGDVTRQTPIPIFMVFPRLFSCPTLETPNFRIEFEVNVCVVFDNYVVSENFPISLHRF